MSLTSAVLASCSTEPHRSGPPAAGLRWSAAVRRTLVSTQPLGSFTSSTHLSTHRTFPLQPWSQACMRWGGSSGGSRWKEGGRSWYSLHHHPGCLPPRILDMVPSHGVERGPELLELVSQSKVLPLIGSDTFDFLSVWHYLPGPMCLVVPYYIATLVAALCSPWPLTQQPEAWI